MTTTDEVTVADRAERVRECADCIVAQLTVIDEERASLEMFGQGGDPKARASATTYNHRIAVAKDRLRIATEQLRTALVEIEVAVFTTGNGSRE